MSEQQHTVRAVRLWGFGSEGGGGGDEHKQRIAYEVRLRFLCPHPQPFKPSCVGLGRSYRSFEFVVLVVQRLCDCWLLTRFWFVCPF